MLKVSHPRGGGVHVRRCLVDDGQLQVDQAGGHLAGVIPQVHPQVRGDLVVAAATRPQLAAEGPQPFEQTSLQRRVHVLVIDGRPETPGTHRLRQVVQRGQDGGELVVVEQTGTAQHPGVRAGRLKIIRGESPVELDAHRQARQRLGGATGKTAAPQPGRRRRYRRLGWRRRGWRGAHRDSRCSRADHTLVGRPHRSMKPRASRWSNWSPAS